MANQFLCLEDFEEEARSKLDRNAWVYYSTGAGTEQTLRNNLQAYNRYLIRPRVLRDVSVVDLSTTILGNKISFPVGVSPTGMHCMAHPDGENATVRACERINTCMILCSYSTISLEDVSANEGLKWFQLQTYKGSEKLVRRAEAAGYKAIVLTVDQPTISPKLADIRVNFSLPAHLKMANFDVDTTQQTLSGITPALVTYYSPDATWTFIDWVRSITSLPIVLKGILRPDDAREALKHDIQGIIVSNHGGRRLDTLPASIDALSDIVKEVNGEVEVYIDGGIRHGTDVLKALALGARAVFIGRPILYGLACNGEEGAYQVLNILKEEIQHAFALSGCNSIDQVQSTKDLVVHEAFYTRAAAKL